MMAVGPRHGDAAHQEWLRRQGLPPEVAYPPDHLRPIAGTLSDPTVWTSLVCAQHDEKDIYAQKGTKGLTDYGGGDTQRDVKLLEDALALIAARKQLLDAADPNAVVIQSSYDAVRQLLYNHLCAAAWVH